MRRSGCAALPNRRQDGQFRRVQQPNVTRTCRSSNLTRIRMLVQDQETAALAARIENRAWLHVGAALARAHAAARRPDEPLLLDRHRPAALAAEGARWRLAFVARRELSAISPGPAAEAAIHDYRCPEDVARFFLADGGPRQHRELFHLPVPPQADIVHARSDDPAPIQGTTWFEPGFCLGTSNRADFWVQRRPLLAYWGNRARPARVRADAVPQGRVRLLVGAPLLGAGEGLRARGW